MTDLDKAESRLDRFTGYVIIGIMFYVGSSAASHSLKVDGVVFRVLVLLLSLIFFMFGVLLLKDWFIEDAEEYGGEKP